MKRVALLSAMLSMAFMMPAQQAFNDCSTAYIVCSNKSISIDQLPPNAGGESHLNTTCSKEGFPVTNNIWFKWRIKSGGSLGFSLLPMDNNDDLDFVLYKMDGGFDNCDQRTAVRCMASGENRGDSISISKNKCSGVTGLSENSTDMAESSGCAASDDNFLAEIQAHEGEEYALLINNYYSTKGFIIEFTGSALLAPIAGHCKESDDTDEIAELNGIVDKGLYIDLIYPNPARHQIALPIISEKAYSAGQWQVLGLHGDIMKINSFAIVPGTNDLNINIENLPIGIYFLKIILGKNVHIARFGKF